MHSARRASLIVGVLVANGIAARADAPVAIRERVENGVMGIASRTYSALREAVVPGEKAVSWKKAATPDWSSRGGAVAVAYNNRMWLIGGRSDAFRNDVWVSDDGESWDLVTAGAAWTPRMEPVVLAYGGKMYLIGGYDAGGWKKDVYSSIDGATWTPVTTGAPWVARYLHAGAVFNGYMWIMGGDYALDPYELNDVWYSTDGADWFRATEHAGWSARRELAAATFGNVMWVVGGSIDFTTNLNDCWYTSNGVNWFQATGSAAWSPRRDHTVVPFQDKLWLIGGYPDGGREVWTSIDASSWVKEATPGFAALYNHSSLVFDERLWVVNSDSVEAWYHDPSAAFGCAANSHSGSAGADMAGMLIVVLLLMGPIHWRSGKIA